MNKINARELGENILEDLKNYPERILTDRLILVKDEMSNLVLTYSICMAQNQEEKVGEVLLASDGEILYGIKRNCRNKGYMTEALMGLLEMSNNDHYLEIGDNNKESQKVAKKAGFQKSKTIGNVHIYRKNT